MLYRWKKNNYKVKFRIILEEKPILRTKICDLKVIYSYQDGDAFRTQLLATKELYSDDPSLVSQPNIEFSEIVLDYNYFDLASTSNNYYKASLNNEKISFNTTEGSDKQKLGLGTIFSLDWSGNVKVYVDFIEVVDDYIWNSFNGAKSIIQSYANNYNNISNIAYWYTKDEPQTIDQYAPYNILNNFVKQISKPLITTFYSCWDTQRENEDAVVRWNKEANPDRLMVDYYPFWNKESPSPYTKLPFLLYHQGLTLLKTANENPNFYYVGQSMAFWDTIGRRYYRKPTKSEFNAHLMHALSYGAKGLMLWNYYSTFNDSAKQHYRIEGLVNKNYQPDSLWYFIKDVFAPRLKGMLGSTLLNLTYLKNYLQLTDGFSDFNSPNNKLTSQYANIIFQDYSTTNMHVGLLQDKNDLENKYFFPVNLECNPATDNKNLRLQFNNFTSYSNYRLRNIENSSLLDTTFYSTITKDILMPAGDGYLLQAAPVVKYGGKMLYNESLPYVANKSLTLNSNMTINNNVIFNVDIKYYINGNITLKPGSKILLGTYGYLFLEDSVKIVKEGGFNTGLVKALNKNKNPRITWGKHNTENYVEYWVWMKYGHSSWQRLGITTNLEYKDLNTVVFVYEGKTTTDRLDILYKVDAYEFDGERLFLASTSDTIKYEKVGLQIEKENSKPSNNVNYVLEQNYPNPFNPETNIAFVLAENENITLTIYDILGNKVVDICKGYMEMGEHSVKFDSKKYNLNSGIYFYTLKAGAFTQTKKMIVLK